MNNIVALFKTIFFHQKFNGFIIHYENNLAGLWIDDCTLIQIAWPFTPNIKKMIVILWYHEAFFRLTVPRCPGIAAGAVSLKKSHDILTLSFCNIVRGQANYYTFNFDTLERGMLDRHCRCVSILIDLLSSKPRESVVL